MQKHIPLLEFGIKTQMQDDNSNDSDESNDSDDSDELDESDDLDNEKRAFVYDSEVKKDDRS
ncbi:19224_t:CDS:2 [Dentiscutata erythropus]|uniref:19224_t:CDS:1 n=1 Tax=Dentiscutata erythropus TaxID=1348616 RepID=A0A9N9JCE9_9GLOM|nr:19224_t:CDS:2 [Dentiscutata erythropus]